MPLKPTSITIGTEFKAFGLDRGLSEGTNLSVTFEVPEGMPRDQLVAEMVGEKEKLDILVLTMEHMRGSIDQERYQILKKRARSGYNAFAEQLAGRVGLAEKAE